MKKTTGIWLLALILGLSGALFGQAGDTSKGSLTVEVQDSSGAIVINATATLNGAMGDRTLKSDSRGQATFFTLVPGIYGLKVELQGFRAVDLKNVIVKANEKTTQLVTLEPGTLTETIQVNENAANVDVTSTTTGSTIGLETLQNIPVARNVAALFSMAPGAAPGGGTDNNNTPNQSLNPSISGASGLENMYIIDGVNTTDQGYGAFGVWSNVYSSLGSGVNFDFVKEMQIKTGGFEAQYGQALGGVLNIVTNSGGNEMHGAAYAYTGPGWLEGVYKQPNDYPRISRPTTEQLERRGYDVGFNMGGPLIKNRAFWYGGFNPKFSSLDRTAPKGYGARDLGPQAWTSRNYNWVGKINFDLTPNHRLEGTAFGDPSRDPTALHIELIRDDVDAKNALKYGTRNWAVKYSGVFSANTLLAGSFAWNHAYFQDNPVNNAFQIRDYSKPKPSGAYTLTGGVGFLDNSDSDNKQVNWMLTKNANFLGGHTLDIGYSFNRVFYAQDRYYSGPGFPVVASAGIDPADVGKNTFGGLFILYPSRTVAGKTYTNIYRQYRGNFNDPAVVTNSDYHSAFVQDAWQINKYITAKLGLRWEEQKLNGNLTQYVMAGNWAPRLGFIIDPTGSRKTKIFANWGRFFEKIPQDMAVRAMSEEFSYNNQHFFSLPPTQANLVPGSVASPIGTEPTIIYGGTKAAYQEELVGGVEHEFPAGVVVGARFIHRQMKRALEDISGITVEQALAGSGQQYVLSNPSINLDVFHNATPCTGGPNCDTGSGYTLDSGQMGADGKIDGFADLQRVYNALEITAEKRFASNWGVYANYRLAKLFGNYEGLFRNDNEQSDPNITSAFDFAYSPALADQLNVGPLPTDRRHVANVFGNYLLKNRFNVGLGWNILSGAPISKFLAHPAYTNAGEIPVGGRGAFGRTPSQNYWNGRLEYRHPLASERSLKLALDVFNIFNRKSVTRIDEWAELTGFIENKDFSHPLAYHRPFYARLSARFEF